MAKFTLFRSIRNCFVSSSATSRKFALMISSKFEIWCSFTGFVTTINQNELKTDVTKKLPNKRHKYKTLLVFLSGYNEDGSKAIERTMINVEVQISYERLSNPKTPYTSRGSENTLPKMQRKIFQSVTRYHCFHLG